MTSNEKYVMVRLCAILIMYTDFYETDYETKDLIDWIIISNRIKANNNQIRKLMQEFQKIDEDYRKGVVESIERHNAICKERGELYEKQQELKFEINQIEQRFNDFYNDYKSNFF